MHIEDPARLREVVSNAVSKARITDVHTHIFPPTFGDLFLWGIDELLTYHYLVAETMRVVDIPYSRFWAMSKREQADLIWKALFIERTPCSEACRGVLTVLSRLGLDVKSRDLESYRQFFRDITVEDYVDRVFELEGIDKIVMTNDPFNPRERKMWLDGKRRDERFLAALRLDVLLNSWPVACQRLREWGYDVSEDLSADTLKGVRRFLEDWIGRMKAVYMAVSLPYDFNIPEDSPRARFIEDCVIPVSRELGVPFAMMIGVDRQVNPGLGDAGDAVGRMNIRVIKYLAARYPENKFMVTLLSRENQHELSVMARKFRNLMIFGCWWFLNNPSLVEEITRMRVELLGTSFIPQHSDARVFDQLIYKWEHSKATIAKVLQDKYLDLLETGWVPEEEEIERDAARLFGDNFRDFALRTEI
ncbi:MAG: glucuronate isomerase [Firmicutes bacterium]|nr:glucuronate isomerase [Bacillota bacterium]